MTLQLNLCANPEVDRLLMEHNNRPLKALYKALLDKANKGIELPMAIITDLRCGIERRAERADVPRYLVGATPLLLAFDLGRLDVAKALLAAGADPNAQSSDGDNPLLAAVRGGNLDAIECLISYGADVNAVDEVGYTALHYAANWRRASVIELLERSGPNLEAVDNEGWTPLHKAAQQDDARAIKVLLNLGANRAAVENDGRTPLHCAAASRYAGVDAIGAFRFNVAAFEANLTTVDNNGHTPLQVYECRSRVSSDNANDSKIRALLTPNRYTKAYKDLFPALKDIY